jgi:two-component system CheB/CheR fusion protein
MQILEMTEVDQYIDCVNNNVDEITKLFRDLLISVTNFFRDAEAFDALATVVIPRLFEQRNAHSGIRIWVPGCATGEEVYSLAILIREYLDSTHTQCRVQIFATDIDENALQVARAGRYPAPLLEHLSPERLQRFSPVTMPVL